MELFGDRNVKWIASQRVDQRIECGGRLAQQQRESIDERPLCRGLSCQQIQRLLRPSGMLNLQVPLAFDPLIQSFGRHDLLAPKWLREGITKVILNTMKTAISIPDEIFEQAERLAKTRGWSRSELYAKAVSAFINGERFLGVREKLNAVYADAADDSTVEPLLANAQVRSIAKENW